eukprot:408761_1
MSTLVARNALKIKDAIVSYPFINQNVQNDCVERIQVKLEQKSNEEIVSLRYAFSQYHPKYRSYLQKNKKSPLYNEIVGYIDKYVEAPIEYKYKIGQYGYITKAETLEKSFGFISKKSEYITEFYFLQDELQRYEFTHCDITSKKFRLLPSDEMEGEAVGWITESIFNPIDGVILPDITKLEQAFNWKVCREDYLLKKMELNKIELTKIADSRGVLFRQTAIQSLEPAVKSIRGKINVLNIGKTVEIGFNLPVNSWMYYFEPTFNDIFEIEEDEELNKNGYWFDLDLDITEFNEVYPSIKFIKLYDQNATAFKFNKSIECEIKIGDDIESIHKKLKDNLNEYSLQRYKKLKQKEEHKYMRLRKVKYLITIDGLKWRFNQNTGKSYFVANCYKTTFLSNGQTVTSGKILV